MRMRYTKAFEFGGDPVPGHEWDNIYFLGDHTWYDDFVPDYPWDAFTDEQKNWFIKCAPWDNQVIAFFKHKTTGTFAPLYAQTFNQYYVSVYPNAGEPVGADTIQFYSGVKYARYNCMTSPELNVSTVWFQADFVRELSTIDHPQGIESIPYDNAFYTATLYFGKNLFCFCKLLRGQFGQKPGTSLDSHLIDRVRQDTDVAKAKKLIDSIIIEANEYAHSNIEDIPQVNNVDFSRTLEQAAMLYAAKFAVLKIMCGQAARLIYK